MITNGWTWDEFAADTRGLADGVNTDKGEFPGRDVFAKQRNLLLWTTLDSLFSYPGLSAVTDRNGPSLGWHRSSP